MVKNCEWDEGRIRATKTRITADENFARREVMECGRVCHTAIIGHYCAVPLAWWG